MKQFKMEILTHTDNKNWRKNVATNKKLLSEKYGLRFQNPNFNILCKIAFWN